jgi:hypothetical protein
MKLPVSLLAAAEAANWFKFNSFGLFFTDRVFIHLSPDAGKDFYRNHKWPADYFRFSPAVV